MPTIGTIWHIQGITKIMSVRHFHCFNSLEFIISTSQDAKFHRGTCGKRISRELVEEMIVYVPYGGLAETLP